MKKFWLALGVFLLVVGGFAWWKSHEPAAPSVLVPSVEQPTVSGSATVPADFPAAVPLPTAATVTGSSTSKTSKQAVYTVVVSLAGDSTAAANTYANTLKQRGFSASIGQSTVTATKNGTLVSALFFADQQTGKTAGTISVTVTQP